MNYSAQVRKDIKAECKARVKSRLGRCIGVQILYALPFILLGLIMVAAMFGTIMSFIPTIEGMESGTISQQAAIMTVLAMFGKMFGGMFLFILLMVALDGPMQFGLMKFYIGLGRGDDPSVGTVFKPFGSIRAIWNGIRMIFCIGFRTWLWMLAPSIIYMILLMVGALYTSSGNGSNMAMGIALMVIGVVVLLVATIFVSVKVLTYYAGWVLLSENDRYGCWCATRDASAAFKGRYGSVLAFVLSFLPWYLLYFAIIIVCEGAMFGGLAIGGLGVILYVVGLIALIVGELLLGTFLTAYEYTSFFGLYNYFRQQMPAGDMPPYQQFTAPQQPVAPQQSIPEQPPVVPPQTVPEQQPTAETPVPQEQPATEPEAPSAEEPNADTKPQDDSSDPQ